jgi:catechol 2,3-dioxygenase
MYTIPLDLRDLVATVEGAEPQEKAGDGLVMGHVHLHVGDVAHAVAFYEALGMEQTAEIPSAAFLSAGGYHHHLGVNVWQGEGVGPAPPGTVGLRRWAIVLPQAADVAATAARLRDAGVDVREEYSSILARDPWETEFVVRAD